MIFPVKLEVFFTKKNYVSIHFYYDEMIKRTLEKKL